MFKTSRLFGAMMARYMDPATETLPGGGAPAPAAGPETFSREYVSELRNESKTYRLKAQETEAKVTAAEAKAADAERVANERVTVAETKANERIIRAELKTAALKAGMHDLDGLKLADLSAVKLNDAGEVEGADALMAAMKESKPYLFQTVSTTTQTAPAPGKTPPAPADARNMTPKEYDAHKKALLAGK